jgi:hypothetical protein
MELRQRKGHATLRRIQVFLDTHDSHLGAVNAGGARRKLDEMVGKLADLESQQDPTRFQRKSELQSERHARAELREKHTKPIARIAQLEQDVMPQFAMLRLPHKRVDSGTLVIWACEMAGAAEPYTDAFQDHGLAPDFIASMLAAVQRLREAVAVRWHAHASRVGATAGVHAESRRVRRVIGLIDALVAPQLEGDDQLVTEWALTTRIGSRVSKAAAAEVAPEAIEPTADL